MTMPTIEKALPLGVTAVEGVIPSASIDDTTEQALVQGLQHVALQVTSFVKDDDILDKGSNGTVNQYPLRLYAQDCPFYLRTGNCKYGLNCKYNHPKSLGRVTNTKVVEAKESKNERERFEQIECKYYLTAEGCKYGKDCRYIHSKEKAETAIPEFNFLGLPIRLGEKECPFYLRTGSCGYGSACRFHHPDPTAVTGFNSHNPPPNGNSVGGLNYIPVNCNGEFDPLHVLRPSKQTAASLSSHVVSEQHVPYSYHSTDALSQKENLNSKCNDYQASFNSVERSFPSLSNADARNQMQTQIEEFPERLGQLECAYFMKTGDCKYRSACRYHHPKSRSSPLTDLTTADLSELHQKHIQFEDFPERPGQQECAYFMKTGECKYRSACRYHHPKNRPQGPGCLLSEKGLPMRPDRKVCWHYEQHGICRYGINCHFDHPENPGLAFQATSASKPLSSNDLPSFGGATDGWAWE